MRKYLFPIIIIVFLVFTCCTISCSRETATPCNSEFLIDSITTLNPYGGLANGRIRVTVLPDSGVTVELNGKKDSANHLFTGLLPGKYIITASSKQGCKSTREITLVEGDGCSQQKFEVTIDTITAPTDKAKGKVRIFIDGDRTGLKAKLLSGNAGSYKEERSGDSLEFTGLNANSKWTIAVANKYGCMDTTAQISIPSTSCPIPKESQLLFTVTTTPSDSCEAKGTVTVNITRNTVAPYTYSFNTNPLQLKSFEKTSYFSDKPIGTFYITVKDANGCSSVTNLFSINPVKPGDNFIKVRTILKQDNCSSAPCHTQKTGTNKSFSISCNVVGKTQAEQILYYIKNPSKHKQTIKKNISSSERDFISKWIESYNSSYSK